MHHIPGRTPHTNREDELSLNMSIGGPLARQLVLRWDRPAIAKRFPLAALDFKRFRCALL